MDKPSKLRRHKRSVTPEKSKAKRKATLFVVEKTKTSVSKKYRDRTESPEPKQRKKNVESDYKPKKTQELERSKYLQKERRKITPERDPIADAVHEINVSLPITIMEFCDTAFKLIQNVNTLLQSTKQTVEDKITDIDKRLVDMDQHHYKNWEIVSETLEVISKHIIDKSNTDSKENNDRTGERDRESPTTTIKDDILQKAEQFSEQNKAKIAEEKAQQEKNEQARILEANSLMMAKNQQTARISLNLTSQGQQIIQTNNHTRILEKQQNVQLESEMTHNQDIRESEQLMRQQIANFYQKQQNARMEQHVAQVEQHFQRQREEIAQSHDIQQQIIGQHERLISSHNEQLAKHKAQLANEPISNMECIIVSDYPKSTSTVATEMPDQRVLRPRPTAQVVLQDVFVQPKQKAPRKATVAAKPIRERRASVQCDRPPVPPFYPHLTMRVPQAAFTQTQNARLVEENLIQLQQTQAYAALKNQEIQQQPKAAKVRERRKSCMPSMSYLDQGMCHEMLRRRLPNAAQSMLDQPNFYPQSMRYFATPQPGTSSDYLQYAPHSGSVGIDLSVDKTGQNLSQDPVDWMRGRSASITRIPNKII